MEVEVLPVAGGNIYSFETKEKCEELVRYTPLKDTVLRGEIEDLALNVYLTLECRDAARVDIRIDSSGSPAFMEINILPGLHPTHSDLPMIAAQEGISYAELIGSIISSALQRSSKQ